MEELSNLFQSRFCFYMPTQAKMLSEGGRCKTFDATADGYSRGEGGVGQGNSNERSGQFPKLWNSSPSKKNHYGQTCPCRNLGASFVYIVASQFLNKQAGEVYETDCQRTHGEESAGKMYVECDILRVYFLSVCMCIYIYIDIYINIYIYIHTGCFTTTTLGVIVHEDGFSCLLKANTNNAIFQNLTGSIWKLKSTSTPGLRSQWYLCIFPIHHFMCMLCLFSKAAVFQKNSQNHISTRVALFFFEETHSWLSWLVSPFEKHLGAISPARKIQALVPSWFVVWQMWSTWV